MSDIEKLPREYPEVDSRMSFEQEQNAQDILARKGINIDWTTGTIQAKNFVGSGTGLWDVGEGTGTGPKGDKGDPGADGKDFKYTDFTQEQLEDLTGPKGDPFVYNDFTPSQLAGLKGPPGNDGKDYDPTVLDNLDKKVEKNTADVSTNRADIAKEVVRNDEQDAAIVDLQDQLDNIEIPEAELEGLVTKEEFDDHEKRNVASFLVVEAELLRIAEEVILNYKDITELHQVIVPELREDIKENTDSIAELEGLLGTPAIEGDEVGSLRLVNTSWDVSTPVDAPVNTCKLHTDRTAMVLNKDSLGGLVNWKDKFEPYPSTIGLNIDGQTYYAVVEFTEQAGQNGRGYNFAINSHNIPDDIANDTVIAFNSDYVIGVEGSFITNTQSKADDKVLQDQIDTKASLSEENTFNNKQTFNKNITFKNAETAIIPTLSSRWHKYSVNPPKNADGTNNTDEVYGVNYYLDAGNSFKNQFKISNRHGDAFEVRGGEDLSGQLHKSWTYSGPQEEDNSIATKVYVDTLLDNKSNIDDSYLKNETYSNVEVDTKLFTKADKEETYTKDEVDNLISSGEGSEDSTGFAPVSEYDYYYLDMEGTSAGRITLCDGNGARTGNLKIIRAIIFNGVDANGKRWARDKDAVSYEKLYTGVASLMTEEGKVVATLGSSGKSTGFSTLHYYKDAVAGFISADTYILEIANSEGLAVTSNITEITYPQKLHLHVSGLHF